MARRGKGKSNTTIEVDFTGVESRGRKKVIPEGEYKVKVAEFDIGKSSTNNDRILFTFEISEGEHEGWKLWHNCSLQPQALFNLKNVLEALEFDIPKKKGKLDLKPIVGSECMVEVAHEVVGSDKKTRIIEFIPLDDNDNSEEDDDLDIEELIEDLEIKELKQLAKSLDIKVKKSMDEEDILEKILECDEEDIEEQYNELFGDDEEEEEEEEDELDYEDMSKKELKALCKERGIKTKKSMGEDDLIELLEEYNEENDVPF